MFTWVAVKELELNFYSKETLLCAIYPYYDNFPEQQPFYCSS